MLFDVDKQTAYWKESSAEDWEVAQELLAKSRIRHSLFFAHLSLEKQLKAIVTHATGAIPPKTHVLLRLADLARFNLSDEQRDFLAVFDRYQLEGRYPETLEPPPTLDEAKTAIQEAKEMRQWLMKQL